MVRRNDIDNLRWMTILLLFPYHTFTLYNNWGENYYVHMEESFVLSLLVKICQPWFMPLLFVLAGVSTVYALERRTPGQYLKERVTKLLVPLVSGILLVVPSLTYFAERFHNGYTGGYLEQYRLFFSKTDLVGYTGGFTPAHLWFLSYLFVVSAAALPLILLWKKHGRKQFITCSQPALPSRSGLPAFPSRSGLPALLCLVSLFSVVWVLSFVLDINGKSLGRYFALFLLGALVISNSEVQDTLEKKRRLLLALWTASTLLLAFVSAPPLLHGGLFQLTGWTGILALLGFSKHYLNFSSPVCTYFKNASFPLYILHLPWIVGIAYFMPQFVTSAALQVTVILLLSFLFTLCSYEAVRRIPLLRTLFAVKAK